MSSCSLDRQVLVSPHLLYADLLRVPANGHEEILLFPADLKHAADRWPHLIEMLRDVRAVTLAQNAIDDLSRRQGEGVGRHKVIDQSFATLAGEIAVEEHG